MHEVACVHPLKSRVALSRIEEHQHFIGVNFISAGLRTDQMIDRVVGCEARDQRRPDNSVIGARRGRSRRGQQLHGFLDGSRHDRRLRGKLHDGGVGNTVFLKGEVDLVIRQRRLHHNDIEVHIPAAELLDGEISEQIGMQCEREIAVFMMKLVDRPGQHLACIHEFDALGDIQGLVVGIQQNACAGRDHAPQRQVFIITEVGPRPERVHVRAIRGRRRLHAIAF